MRTSRVDLAAMAYAALLAAAGSLLLVARRDRLADRLVLHWGTDGPDRYAGFGQTVALAVGLTLGTPVVMLLIALALRQRQHSDLAAVGVGTATMLAVVGFGLPAAQGAGEALPHPAGWVFGGLAAGLATGFAFGWWARPAPAVGPASRGPLPADAPRLDVSPTTRLAWVGYARPSRPILLGSVVAVLVPAAVLALTDHWPAALVFVGPLLLLVLLTGGRVVVDQEGVSIRTAGVITWARVPMERVSSAQVGQVDAFREFGGWGYRMAPDGRRGLVTRSGPALIVHRTGQPDLLATVDDADQAAAVLNTLVTR